MKIPNDSLQISLPELKKLVRQMEESNLYYIILSANYCRANMLRGSKEWNEVHEKKGHKCKICYEIKQRQQPNN